MTPEEILAKFAALGIRPNQWEKVEEHTATPSQFEEVAEGLKKLKDALEAVAQEDRQKIVELKTQIRQMTRGGGR
jgi:hypothetical protein